MRIVAKHPFYFFFSYFGLCSLAFYYTPVMQQKNPTTVVVDTNNNVRKTYKDIKQVKSSVANNRSTAKNEEK